VVKEKFYWSEFFFVILAFLGSIIVGMKDFGDLSSIGYGELMAFIGSIGFALSYIARKRQSDALNNKEISFLMLALGSSMVFIISLVI
jgi:drug/metabolite transporter (DMT)-like permease